MKDIKLCSVKDCTYCSACISSCNVNAIKFKYDEYGFGYPHIDNEKCTSCYKCVKSCPVIHGKRYNDNVENTVYAIYSNDKYNIIKSSSGGLFFEIAQSIIYAGGIVYGVVYKKGRIYHTAATSLKEVEDMRGSKYVQSEMDDIYRSVKSNLLENKMILFTGTPCQIAGLKSFLHREYENLITIDLVCHGVPSKQILDQCIKLHNINPNDCYSISFRDTKTWNFLTTLNLNSGRNINLFWSNDIYMKLFMRKLTYKSICYKCPFAKLPRVADITLGDFWGIKNDLSFKINKRGTSVMMLNSQKGKMLFDKIKGNFTFSIRKIGEATANNPNIIMPTHMPINRDVLLKDLFSLSKNELVTKYNMPITVRNILGYFKRKIQKTRC